MEHAGVMADPARSPAPAHAPITGRLRHLAVAFGLVAAATAVAVILRAAYPAYNFSFFLYIPAIGAAAYSGGREPGFVATGLSVVSAVSVLAPPVSPLVWARDLSVILGVFALVSLSVALGASRLREVEQERSALLDSQRRARAEAELVNAITAATSGVDDLERMLSAVLGLLQRVVPFTGGSLILLDGDELVCRAAVGPFADRALGARLPRGQGRIWKVVETGEPFECADLIAAGYQPTTPLRSYLAVPLVWLGRSLGLLEVDSTVPNAFSAADLSLVQRVASALSGTIELSKRYERERRVAEMLQRAFLPARLPELPGVGLHAAYLPAAHESEIGGDWYDVFQLPDGRVALSLGDIAGRGLHAAVAMGQVRQAIRAAALEDHAPPLVLERASRLLLLSSERGAMATAVFGILDLGSMTFWYSIAGNPAPVLATPDGCAEVLASGGLPLGVEGVEPRRAWTVSLPPGALLVLYTDGLVEYKRDVIQGEAVLLDGIRAEAIARSTDPARAIQEHVLDGLPPADDVALLTVSLAPVPLEEFDLVLPAEPSALAPFRQALRRLSSALGLTADRAFALQVAVGEAVNNVIEHAYGPAGGTVRAHARRESGAVVVDIEDHGGWRPERPEKQGRGRGIGLMRGLVDSAEIRTTPSGTTVRVSIGIADARLKDEPVQTAW